MNFDQVLESLRASQALEAAKALEDKMHSSVNQVASDGDASPITGNDSNLNSTAVVVHDLSSDLTPEFRHSTPVYQTSTVPSLESCFQSPDSGNFSPMSFMSPETPLISPPMRILAFDQSTISAASPEQQHNYHGFENRPVHPLNIHTVREVIIGGEEEEEDEAEEYANLNLLKPLGDDGEPQDEAEGEESEDEQSESDDDEDTESTDKEEAVEVAPSATPKRSRQVADNQENPNVDDDASAGPSKRRRTYSKSRAQATQSSEKFIIDVIVAEAETSGGGTQVYVKWFGYDELTWEPVNRRCVPASGIAIRRHRAHMSKFIDWKAANCQYQTMLHGLAEQLRDASRSIKSLAMGRLSELQAHYAHHRNLSEVSLLFLFNLSCLLSYAPPRVRRRALVDMTYTKRQHEILTRYTKDLKL